MARRGRGSSARTKAMPGGRDAAVNGSVADPVDPGDEPGARTIGALALKRWAARGPGRGDAGDDIGAGPPTHGPFDEDDVGDKPVAPDRVDFGAVRVPVPRGGEVSVEPEDGRLQAVHVMLPAGRLSVSALAAPRTERLWPDLAAEIDESLREGGATVRSFTGEWGRELHARTGDASSLFVGVDGPRWMLYGVATGPTSAAAELDAALRTMLRGTVVVRGRSPYPVRTVLPLTVPGRLPQAGVPDRVPVPRMPAERTPAPARPAPLVDAPTTITAVAATVADGVDTVPHGIPRSLPGALGHEVAGRDEHRTEPAADSGHDPAGEPGTDSGTRLGEHGDRRRDRGLADRLAGPVPPPAGAAPGSVAAAARRGPDRPGGARPLDARAGPHHAPARAARRRGERARRGARKLDAVRCATRPTGGGTGTATDAGTGTGTGSVGERARDQRFPDQRVRSPRVDARPSDDERDGSVRPVRGQRDRLRRANRVDRARRPCGGRVPQRLVRRRAAARRATGQRVARLPRALRRRVRSGRLRGRCRWRPGRPDRGHGVGIHGPRRRASLLHGRSRRVGRLDPPAARRATCAGARAGAHPPGIPRGVPTGQARSPRGRGTGRRAVARRAGRNGPPSNGPPNAGRRTARRRTGPGSRTGTGSRTGRHPVRTPRTGPDMPQATTSRSRCRATARRVRRAATPAATPGTPRRATTPAAAPTGRATAGPTTDARTFRGVARVALRSGPRPHGHQPVGGDLPAS